MWLKNLKKIPINKILVGRSVVRVKGIEKNINELANSIKALGLIQPIIVYTNSEHEYFVIVGQRRLRALHLLDEQYPGEGFDKVDCLIHDEQNEQILKAMSVATDIHHSKPDKQNLAREITRMFTKYDNVKITAARYGISEKIIKKYVKFGRLPEFLKERVASKQIRLDIALKVIDALDWTEDGRESSETLLAIITEVEKLKKSNRRAYKNALRILAEPVSVSDIVTDHDKLELILNDSPSRRHITLKIKLTEEDFERLLSSDKRQPKRHPWDQGITVESLVIDIIHDYLVRAEVEDY